MNFWWNNEVELVMMPVTMEKAKIAVNINQGGAWIVEEWRNAQWM